MSKARDIYTLIQCAGEGLTSTQLTQTIAIRFAAQSQAVPAPAGRKPGLDGSACVRRFGIQCNPAGPWSALCRSSGCEL